MASRKRTEVETTAPTVDYERAARMLSEGRTREEVMAVLPEVDLDHWWLRDRAREMEEADGVSRPVDRSELRRRLIEIAEDEATTHELRVKIYVELLDRS